MEISLQEKRATSLSSALFQQFFWGETHFNFKSINIILNYPKNHKYLPFEIVSNFSKNNPNISVALGGDLDMKVIESLTSHLFKNVFFHPGSFLQQEKYALLSPFLKAEEVKTGFNIIFHARTNQDFQEDMFYLNFNPKFLNYINVFTAQKEEINDYIKNLINIESLLSKHALPHLLETVKGNETSFEKNFNFQSMSHQISQCKDVTYTLLTLPGFYNFSKTFNVENNLKEMLVLNDLFNKFLTLEQEELLNVLLLGDKHTYNFMHHLKTCLNFT